jgi:hypothetical protein
MELSNSIYNIQLLSYPGLQYPENHVDSLENGDDFYFFDFKKMQRGSGDQHPKL